MMLETENLQTAISYKFKVVFNFTFVKPAKWSFVNDWVMLVAPENELFHVDIDEVVGLFQKQNFRLHFLQQFKRCLRSHYGYYQIPQYSHCWKLSGYCLNRNTTMKNCGNWQYM
jgi:hypothetical protein